MQRHPLSMCNDTADSRDAKPHLVDRGLVLRRDELAVAVTGLREELGLLLDRKVGALLALVHTGLALANRLYQLRVLGDSPV